MEITHRIAMDGITVTLRVEVPFAASELSLVERLSQLKAGCSASDILEEASPQLSQVVSEKLLEVHHQIAGTLQRYVLQDD